MYAQTEMLCAHIDVCMFVCRGEPIKGATACLAEIGTVQIEFTRLSEITGNWKYHYAVRKEATKKIIYSHAA